MLAALITIGVLGIGLPAGLWLVTRWRKFVPEKPQVYGEVNEWLFREHGLGPRDRSRVQAAVLGRYAAVSLLDPSPLGPSPRGPSPQATVSLRPELLDAARGLADRVVADGFRRLRTARLIGWVQLATGAVAVAVGIGILAAGWGGNRFFGVYAVLEGGLFVFTGAYSALVIARRRRRSAQTYLAMSEPGRPGSLPVSAGRPDNHDGNGPPG